MSAPQKIDNRQNELFRKQLSQQLNPRHELVILRKEIDWDFFEESFGHIYVSKKGHPPKPIQLMVGLLMLQHMAGVSDEEVVNEWVENPYWQYFCGYEYLQWGPPINPSSLTRWSKRLGVEGMEKILKGTINTALKTEVIKEKDLKQDIADTTVMEKAITYPTDSALFLKAREKLVKLCKKHGVVLRQAYTHLGRKAYQMACRYGHAQQFKRMRKKIKLLKNYLGRVVRDIDRQLEKRSALGIFFKDFMDKSKRLLSQTKESTNKLYALHAPEVYCISKGKTHKKYEFGTKVSLAVTVKKGIALCSQALEENIYDGHTLKDTLSRAMNLTETPIERVLVDAGYKGHDVTDIEVLRCKDKKLALSLKKALKRRSSIEPMIGHMKQGGKLGRNYLKGFLGGQLNAILSAVGHNLRLILNHLKYFLPFLSLQQYKDPYQEALSLL